MLRRILIANRGEIALRILRACHEMGKEVVAAYSQVDKNLRHLDLADDIVCIGKQSYLNPNDLIMAAKTTGCDGIHPGYGLLSENEEFARLAVENGLEFVGPSAELLKKLGDKSTARQLVATEGLVPIPGSEDVLSSLEVAVECASTIGYPMVLKASYGGGGRGIRLIHDERELRSLYAEAKAEAQVNFGKDDLYLEKYLGNARHIEVQILGDGRGGAIHLGTRDCSIQRRHQKVVEEAPAPGIDQRQLDEIANLGARTLGALKYKNAATLEFLYEDGAFYFLEINTRLQVEHPVTEMITGIDIVKAQLAIADTGQLPFTQEDVVFRGCSLECRINAEDQDFQPSPGLVTDFVAPGGNGVRVDTHLYPGYVVPHQYDSLIAKLIVHGQSRDETLAKMRQALREIKVEGIETGIPLLSRILEIPDFVQATYNAQLLNSQSQNP